MDFGSLKRGGAAPRFRRRRVAARALVLAALTVGAGAGLVAARVMAGMLVLWPGHLAAWFAVWLGVLAAGLGVGLDARWLWWAALVGGNLVVWWGAWVLVLLGWSALTRRGRAEPGAPADRRGM